MSCLLNLKLILPAQSSGLASTWVNSCVAPPYEFRGKPAPFPDWPFWRPMKSELLDVRRPVESCGDDGLLFEAKVVRDKVLALA